MGIALLEWTCYRYYSNGAEAVYDTEPELRALRLSWVSALLLAALRGAALAVPIGTLALRTNTRRHFLAGDPLVAAPLAPPSINCNSDLSHTLVYRTNLMLTLCTFRVYTLLRTDTRAARRQEDWDDGNDSSAASNPPGPLDV